jgi:hypothetical protein
MHLHRQQPTQRRATGDGPPGRRWLTVDNRLEFGRFEPPSVSDIIGMQEDAYGDPL